MRTTLPVILPALALAAGLVACDVDVEEKGELPKVDVQGEPGKLPEYEVHKVEEGRAPDVDVDVQGGQAPDVEVRGPEVEVDRKTVEVPDVDINPPPEDDTAPRQ